MASAFIGSLLTLWFTRPANRLLVLLLLLCAGDIESNPGPSNLSLSEREHKLISQLKDLKKLLKPKTETPFSAEKKSALLSNVNDILGLVGRRRARTEVRDAAYYEKVLTNINKTKLRSTIGGRKKYSPDLKTLDLAENIALQKHLVYEDGKLLVYVKRIAFKKQKNYAMSDHHYKIKVVAKEIHGEPQSPPTIESISTEIHVAIIDIVNELRSQLDPNMHSQIYFCFLSTQLDSPVNTGNYDLNSGPTEQIVQQVMATF